MPDQTPAPGNPLAGIAAKLTEIAIDYHKTVEGEYGCPGATCPGVQRLVKLLERALREAVVPPSQGDLLYRAGEWEAIAAMLSDRDEIGLYAKVEALLREAVVPPTACECGALLTQCSSCAVGDWQAAHPECRTCCPVGPIVPPPAWQPMGTHPKDGRWLLGWHYDFGHFVFRDGPGLITSEDPMPTHWMPLPASPASAGTEQT